MIDPIKRKPISKPRPYKDIRGKYKWVVYFHDTQKDVRTKKLFSEKFEADEFYRSQSITENRLGAQANNISIEDKRDILEAKRILEPFEITFLDTVRTYAKLTEELSGYNATLAQVVESYKEWAQLKNQSASLRRAIETFTNSKMNEDLSERYAGRIAFELERFCEAFGNKRTISMISHTEIENWLNGLKKRVYVDSPNETLNGRPKKIFVDTDVPISTVTKKGFRTLLYGFFKFCKMRNWVNENPVEKITLIRRRLKTPEFFKADEIENMLSKTEPLSDIRAYIAIGAFAGLRSAELMRLRWDKIKISDREIVMDNEVTKTGSRRVVKIMENLAEWLEPYSEKFSTTENVILPNLIKRLRNFRDTNNIKWINNGLRHSAATHYLALTKNAYETAEQMGHAVDVLKQHYNGLAREKEAITYFEIRPDKDDNRA